MTRFELVIAGGGLAAARAIKSYREAGGMGRIALLSEEQTLPYHRPALSKKYLRGESTETPHVEEEGFYRDHDVDVLLDAPATDLDLRACVLTAGARRFGFEKLLIATGATPRRLNVPGAELDGVFPLRTVGDSAAIREAAASARRAVVVGGGFIGMEAAASLRELGLDVTLIHLGSGLFDQLRSQQLSHGLLELYRDRGTNVLLEEEVSAFRGVGQLTAVETAGGRRVEADIAVFGVGVLPNVDFLAGSGLALENGVVVNARFETDTLGVYAVGDVANFFDPLYGRQRRIEHWSNANYQGSEVGKLLAGAGGGYDTVSSFFSEVFGVTIKVFGDVTRFDALTTEGSLADGFLASYGDGGRLVGALTVGQSEELETLVKELLAERAPADALDRPLTLGRAA
jgi:3-phenylpropionate/trans-cinnamate dioxygenase ferredoxin reductase component